MATLQRAISADEYIRRSEAGEYGDARTEFINGEVRELPEGWWHYEVALLLVNALRAAVGPQHFVVGSSIRFMNDVPQPDVSVLRSPRSEYSKNQRVLDFEEVIFVCEVSHSTYDLDSGERMARYAAASIPEYWIVNLEDEASPTVEVYREPLNGKYTQRAVFAPGYEIPLPAHVADDKALAVSEFLS